MPPPPATLDQASSQSEYNRLLEFEKRDLRIRELKQECFSLFQHLLSEHLGLAQNAAYTYTPQEVFYRHLWRQAEIDENSNFLIELGNISETEPPILAI